MDNDVIVSIGMPVYNAGRYLRFAIDSVLAQTFPDFELIITSDGSSDDSVEIAGSYNDPRIRLIIDNTNRGVPYRINQQIKMARGRFFARMDADDIMFPWRIEKQLKYLLDHPETDVTGSEAVVIDEKNIVIGYRNSNPEFTSETILKEILFNHPTICGKKEWFTCHPYNEELSGAEDYYLWNTTLRESKFHIMTFPLMFYRDPPSSSVETYLRRQKVLRKVFKILYADNLITKSQFRKLTAACRSKSMIYSILSVMNLSGTLIARRNRRLDSEHQNNYQNLLHSIISG